MSTVSLSSDGPSTSSLLPSDTASAVTDSGKDRVADLTSRIRQESSPVRQGQMLAQLDALTGERQLGNTAALGNAATLGARVLMAQGGAQAITPGGQATIPLDRIEVPDLGRVAIPLSRLSALGAVLTLSGDTPQPTRVDLGNGLQLYVSHDRSAAWFQKDAGAVLELGPIRFMPRSERLDVPVTVSGGQISFDAAQLQEAFGRPLPENVLAMARPAGVPAALQTTSSGITRAMAGAPDPCRDLPGQRHHIIPAEIMGANEAFLTRIGFTLDQPANMVKLPANTDQRDTMQDICQETRPIHSGRHPSSYGRAISDKLADIEGRNLSAGESRELVNHLMGEIRTEISSGRYANINDPRLAQFISNLRL